MHLQITKTGYLAHWHFSLMVGQVFCTCLAIFLSISAKSQTTLVGWDFEDQNAVSDSGIAINAGCEITSNTNGEINFTSGSSGSGSFSIHCTQWDGGYDQKYWQINFTSLGYKGLTLSSKQRSSGRGPRDFKLSFSLDGQIWMDAGTTILVKDNFTSGKVVNFSLPSICDDQSIVYIRWLVNSNVDVNGTTIDGRGTSRVDDIEVKGFLIPVLTSNLNHSCCSGSPINYIPAGSGIVYNWSRSRVAGITEEANSGSGIISEILTNTTPLPIMVDFTFDLELNGVTNRQTVVVTVNPKPGLAVSPVSQILCPNSPPQPIIFSNPNPSQETAFFWEWTGLNSEKLSVTPSSGTLSPINTTINTSEPTALLETTIKITATSMQGCSYDQVVTLSVGDNLPPTFTELNDTLTFCVEDIFDATANGADDITEPRPEYFTMIPNHGILDLNPSNFNDNCTEKEAIILHWRIDFYQNPNPITGTGQPSLRERAIVFPGSAENVVNHKITYWLEDAYGNITPNDQRVIVVISVHPRPHIEQDF